MALFECEHKHTQAIDLVTTICNDCGLCVSLNEFVSEFELEFDKTRTLLPTSIDGNIVQPGQYNNKPNILNAIKRTLSTLNFSNFESRVVAIYNRVSKDFEIGQGQLLGLVIASCAIIVIREEKAPITIREIAAMLELNVYQLSNTLNIIRSNFHPSVTTFLELEILITRALNEMFENDGWKNRLPLYNNNIKALRHLEENWRMLESRGNYETNIVTGRQPAPIAGAIILLALEATERPSFDEWKINHKNIAKSIGTIVNVDSSCSMQERYRELVDIMSNKITDIPWAYLAHKNKNRSYLYINDVLQFHDYIMESHEKNTGKPGKNSTVAKRPHTNFISEDEDEDLELLIDDDEIDQYIRDEDEVENLRNLQDSILADQDDQFMKKQPKKRSKLLHLKKQEPKQNITNNDGDNNDDVGSQDKSDQHQEKNKGKGTQATSKKILMNPNDIDIETFDYI
ncbi:10536_t:CDS:2 [Entrophospora sp. SA101]|nr:10536_t:CDS:2 [Entrophospora sp. SA101]CAJ0909062.1 11709_t:CDS:2 [Entrophospora sp. SA101]